MPLDYLGREHLSAESQARVLAIVFLGERFRTERRIAVASVFCVPDIRLSPDAKHIRE